MRLADGRGQRLVDLHQLVGGDRTALPDGTVAYLGQALGHHGVSRIQAGRLQHRGDQRPARVLAEHVPAAAADKFRWERLEGRGVLQHPLDVDA